MAGLTYNNHPASCAAALANLEIIEREGLVENSRDVGSYLLESLRQAMGDHPFVAEIRGIGMLAALECTAPGTVEPIDGRPMAYPAAVATRCWDRGLIARALWENVALAPPLCTTRSEVDEIVSILSEVMREVAEDFPTD
jgi:L-2,4-diaminobutyrate transaminase